MGREIRRVVPNWEHPRYTENDAPFHNRVGQYKPLFRPDWPAGAATWYQAYETVSEGTPISPPFATEDELIEWLSTHADFWNQGPRTWESAVRFVRGGWAPSAVMYDGTIAMNTDALDLIAARTPQGPEAERSRLLALLEEVAKRFEHEGHGMRGENSPACWKCVWLSRYEAERSR